MILCGFSRLSRTLTLLSQRFLHTVCTPYTLHPDPGQRGVMVVLKWGHLSHNSGSLQLYYGYYGVRSAVCKCYGLVCPNHVYQAKYPATGMKALTEMILSRPRTKVPKVLIVWNAGS
jgi:hypothetical protein